MPDTYTPPVTSTPAHPITGRLTNVCWKVDPALPILRGGPLRLVLTLITDNESLVEYVDVLPLDERAVYTIGEQVTFAAGEYRLVAERRTSAASRYFAAEV